MTLAQTNAVVARIQTITALSSKTFKLVAPKDAQGKVTAVPPYVVVQPSDGNDSAESFTGPPVTSHPQIVLHVVGSSYDNAQTVSELIKAKFVTPNGFPINFTASEVTGQVGKHLSWSTPIPTQVDNDVSPPMIYNSHELSWDSDPV